MEEKNTKLGEVLKNYRGKAFPDMGLRRVANEVGIDYAHLFRIESGQYTPSDDSLIKLLDAYKVDPIGKLEVFNLARVTPCYQKIINAAHNKDPKSFVNAFYRKNKDKDDKNKKK